MHGSSTADGRTSAGFGPRRSIFNGADLTGWRAVPRTPVPEYPGGPYHPEVDDAYRRRALTSSGRWQVVDGVLVGGQEPPGSGLGGYLVTEETFADFELAFEVRPDWPVDTGVLVRSTDLGSQGFQLLVDHRQSGGIGGFYGNGTGAFHALGFAMDARRDADGRPVGLVLDDPTTSVEPVTPAKQALLSYSASPEEFLRSWRWDDWNAFTVTCVGEFPVLTSWINGVKMCEVDTGSLVWPTYDREAVAALLGRSGHIALEVHHNDPGLGEGRWAPGAVVRFRNIAVREPVDAVRPPVSRA